MKIESEQVVPNIHDQFKLAGQQFIKIPRFVRN